MDGREPPPIYSGDVSIYALEAGARLVQLELEAQRKQGVQGSASKRPYCYTQSLVPLPHNIPQVLIAPCLPTCLPPTTFSTSTCPTVTARANSTPPWMVLSTACWQRGAPWASQQTTA